MFIGYQGNKIKFYTEQTLNSSLYNIDKIEETDKVYVLCGDEYVLETSEKYIEYQKAQRKQEIYKLLDELDLKSIRAIRTSDEEYIEKYEQEAQELREELRELGE